MVNKSIEMTLIQYRNHFREALSHLYSSPEIDDLFKRTIKHYFQWESLKIGLTPQYELSQQEKHNSLNKY